eukprot:m.14700 g.14700  ORF g.14700 m.14700 type:complete len:302 (+) comp10330_c0_seq3:109-1014(+)
MDAGLGQRNVPRKQHAIALNTLKPATSKPSSPTPSAATTSIVLRKTTSFGIVVAASPCGRGIFIAKIAPDTPAARCSHLRAGQRILAVDGQSALKWTRRHFGQHVSTADTLELQVTLDLATFAGLDGGVALRNATLAELATVQHELAPPALAPNGIVLAQAALHHVTMACRPDAALATLEGPIQEALASTPKLRGGAKLQLHASKLQLVTRQREEGLDVTLHLLDVINAIVSDRYLVLIEKRLVERPTCMRATKQYHCHVFKLKNAAASATFKSYLRVQLAEVFEMVRNQATRSLTQETEA